MGLMRRKSVRAVLALLVVSLLAVVAVMVFLPVEKIRDLALEQAKAKLGREVSVGDVAISLKGGLGVKLADFAIHNPDGIIGSHFLTAESLDLKLALRPLLKKEIRVDRLVVEGPAVNLMVLDDGSNNFTFTQATSSGEATVPSSADDPTETPPPLSVASLALLNGRVTYSDATADEAGFQALEMAGLNLTLSLADPAPGRFQAQGRLKADKIIVTGAGSVPELSASADFDLTWDTPTSQLTLTRVDALVMNLPLSATGQMMVAEGAATGQVHLKANDLALVDLAVMAPAELAAKINGNKASGTVNATVDLKLTGNKAAPLHTSGTIKAQNVDLSLAQPFLPPQQSGNLAGRGDIELNFSQEGSALQKLTYTGSATVREVSYTQSGLVDDLQKLDATLTFTSQEFTVKKCQAQFGSGTFDLRGKLRDPFPYFLPPELQGDEAMKTPHLSFALRSPRLDVDKLMPSASPTGSEGKPNPPPGNNSITSKITVEFPDLTCDGTFEADSLIYMQVPFTKVAGEVKIRDRVLSCNHVSGDVYHGKVEGQVDINLKDMNNPMYTGNYQAKAIEVNDFVNRFAGLNGVVFGGCNLGGNFAAHGLDPNTIRNSLTLDADAGLKQGRLVTTGNVHQALTLLASQAGQTLSNEQVLRDLATHIKVENGRVGLEDLSTQLGHFGELSLGGYYAFSGEVNYTGKITLTKDQTSKLFTGGVLGELGTLLGSQRPERLELPLSVGGTRSDPKVKLDLGSVTSDLQQKVVKEQGAKLEDTAKNKLNELLKKWK